MARTASAVALRTPAASDRGRARVGVHRGKSLDVPGRETGLGGGAFDCPGLGALRQLLRSRRMGPQKLAVRPSRREQPPDDRQRQRQIGSGAESQVEVRALRHARPPRVHDHQPRAALLGVLDVRHEVDPGDGRVDPPQHDEVGVGVILSAIPGILP